MGIVPSKSEPSKSESKMGTIVKPTNQEQALDTALKSTTDWIAFNKVSDTELKEFNLNITYDSNKLFTCNFTMLSNKTFSSKTFSSKRFSSKILINRANGMLFIKTLGIKYFIEKAYSSNNEPVIVLKKIGDDAKILVWITKNNSKDEESIKSNLNEFIASLATDNYKLIYEFNNNATSSGGSLRKRKGSKKKKSQKVRSEKKKRKRKNSRKNR